MEPIKKNQIDIFLLKNVTPEIQNSMDGVNRRLDIEEDRVVNSKIGEQKFSQVKHREKKE